LFGNEIYIFNDLKIKNLVFPHPRLKKVGKVDAKKIIVCGTICSVLFPKPPKIVGTVETAKKDFESQLF